MKTERAGCCCVVFISEEDARVRHLDCCPMHGREAQLDHPTRPR